MELEYHYLNSFSKNSLLDLKLLWTGSLSSLYAQSFVLPSSALYQLLMFMLFNRKDSPLSLSLPSPLLCPLFLHAILYMWPKWSFQNWKSDHISQSLKTLELLPIALQIKFFNPAFLRVHPCPPPSLPRLTSAFLPYNLHHKTIFSDWHALPAPFSIILILWVSVSTSLSQENLPWPSFSD